MSKKKKQFKHLLPLYILPIFWTSTLPTLIRLLVQNNSPLVSMNARNWLSAWPARLTATCLTDVLLAIRAASVWRLAPGSSSKTRITIETRKNRSNCFENHYLKKGFLNVKYQFDQQSRERPNRTDPAKWRTSWDVGFAFGYQRTLGSGANARSTCKSIFPGCPATGTVCIRNIIKCFCLNTTKIC